MKEEGFKVLEQNELPIREAMVKPVCNFSQTQCESFCRRPDEDGIDGHCGKGAGSDQDACPTSQARGSRATTSRRGLLSAGYPHRFSAQGPSFQAFSKKQQDLVRPKRMVF